MKRYIGYIPVIGILWVYIYWLFVNKDKYKPFKSEQEADAIGLIQYIIAVILLINYAAQKFIMI